MFNMFQITYVFVMFYLCLNLHNTASCAPLPLLNRGLNPTAYVNPYSGISKYAWRATGRSSEGGTHTGRNRLSTSLSKGLKHISRTLEVGIHSTSNSLSAGDGRGEKHAEHFSKRGTITDTSSVTPGAGVRQITENVGHKKQKQNREEESDCGDVKGEGCKKQRSEVNGREAGDRNMIIVGVVGSVLGLIASMAVIWYLVWRVGKGKDESKEISEQKIVEKDIEEERMNVKEKAVKKVRWDLNIMDSIDVETTTSDTSSVDKKDVTKTGDMKHARKHTEKNTKKNSGTNMKRENIVGEKVNKHDDNFIPWGHPPEILREVDEGESRWCYIIGF